MYKFQVLIVRMCIVVFEYIVDRYDLIKLMIIHTYMMIAK